MIIKLRRNTLPATLAAAKSPKLLRVRQLRLIKLMLILSNECTCKEQGRINACKDGYIETRCTSNTSLAKAMSTFDLYLSNQNHRIDDYLNKKSEWRHNEIKRIFEQPQAKSIKELNIAKFKIMPRSKSLYF
jgi:hypothetical protein